MTESVNLVRANCVKGCHEDVDEPWILSVDLISGISCPICGAALEAVSTYESSLAAVQTDLNFDLGIV